MTERLCDLPCKRRTQSPFGWQGLILRAIEEDSVVGADEFTGSTEAGENLVGLGNLPSGQPTAEGLRTVGPRTKPADADSKGNAIMI
jgi:hypothetical protein